MGPTEGPALGPGTVLVVVGPGTVTVLVCPGWPGRVINLVGPGTLTVTLTGGGLTVTVTVGSGLNNSPQTLIPKRLMMQPCGGGCAASADAAVPTTNRKAKIAEKIARRIEASYR